jgi:predicted Rossmann fold flavoprotein
MKLTGHKVEKYQVIVVGGGPAGLMAAGQAAGLGADAVLLEKGTSPGRKLRITGKGRCNLTNIASLPDFIAHFGKNGRFLRQAFDRFFSSDLVGFLREMGVDIVTERGGRVFPASEDAQAVNGALLRWVKLQGVSVKTNSPVKQLLVSHDGIHGVQIGDRELHANAVIIATGGASYPTTGSTGDGYRLAASVGHTIIPVRPALVPLETAGDVAPRLQGLSLRNVRVRVRIDGRKRHEAFGEMLFTHFGLSGPIILSLSGKIVDALLLKKKVTLSIDLKPALDDQKLDARLLRDLDAQGKKQFHSLLKGLLPNKLIPVCCDLIGIPPDKTSNQISATERRRLRMWLKDFQFDISGHRPLKEAIVTAGGIQVREVNPRTMASLLVPGLYFAGEVLDINGDTGGYNLQAAFSTGWLAGQSAAKMSGSPFAKLRTLQ